MFDDDCRRKKGVWHRVFRRISKLLNSINAVNIMMLASMFGGIMGNKLCLYAFEIFIQAHQLKQ